MFMPVPTRSIRPGRRPILLATSCLIDYAFGLTSRTTGSVPSPADGAPWTASRRASGGSLQSARHRLAIGPTAFAASRQQRCSFTSLHALRPSRQHPLLSLPESPSDDGAVTVSAPDIQTAFLARNIHKVAFIRHGNTAPASVDFDRELTELGREQSRAAGASYGVAELFPFYEGGALCSPAGRCVETADLFLGAASQTLLDSTEGNGGGVPTIPPLELRSQLYDGTMQPEGSRLFRSIGYAPLREYLENPDEKDRDAARSVLGGYAQGALDAIWDVVSNADAKEVEGAAGKTLLFFAHAIYLPSAVLGFAASIGCDGDDGVDLVLDTDTKEAEGYCVHVDAPSVSSLCRPETA